MTNSRNYRTVGWTERGALFLLAAFLCLHALPRAWRTLNTDFPNYYMSARLAHEGYDTSRMYEWTWLQREKDHRAVDIRTIGLLPITPFSTLAMWPLTDLAPLTAKHVWILLNLAFLIPLCWLLRSMTGLSYRRIALIFALSFPLYRNLSYGQFYIFLLLLIVSACWAYLRDFRVLAGALVAIAGACKIFPILFLVFFLQRKDWRALAAAAVTGLAAIAVSVAVFGLNVHRTYLHEILPWSLHGEAMPPYVASASISGVLHRLFLTEPQWNPHPWHYSPLCYALLLPTLQMLAFAPAILLIRRKGGSPARILLEWSALLTAALTISTVPALYNFVLMVFPVCVLAAMLLQLKRYGWLATLLIVYVGIGLPTPSPHSAIGPTALLYLLRLPLMLGLLIGIYALLYRQRPERAGSRDWTPYAWTVALVLSVVFSAVSTFRRERAVRREYAYRLPLKAQGFLNARPEQTGTGIRYIAFTLNGYHLVADEKNEVGTDPDIDFPDDDLSFTSGLSSVGNDKNLVERGLSPRSAIVDARTPSRVLIDDAREPMLSADGQSVAFVRDDQGRGRLTMRSDFESEAPSESALTPPSLNIYGASFLSKSEYAFSAVSQGHPPQIYLSDATHTNAPLALGESRYPALSPDRRWLAYSRLENGVWNLWLRNQKTGATRPIASLPCNQIQPAWEADSKTLLYSTDCGRSLWFTAISRRRVIP